MKRKRATATSTATPTEQDESENEEIVSDDEVEFDEDAELDASDSDFEAPDEAEVDDESSDEDFVPRKSPRKNFVRKVASDVVSDSEEEAQMIGLAIDLSKETFKEEGRRLGGSAGASSNVVALRANAAERRRSSGLQTAELGSDYEELDVAVSDLPSEDGTPLASNGKGKGKETQKKPMTKAEYRAYRREIRREKRLTRNYVKQEEKALALKLGRRLTHAERTTLSLHRCHPELKNVWDDLETYVKPIRTQKAEQPEELKIDLLPFQLESLYWMREQEKGEYHGGMLAVSLHLIRTSFIS